jgi:hypothetical protein
MNAHEAPSNRDRIALLLLAGALVLGLSRFVRLSEWSLWIDEAFTLGDALAGRETRNPLGYALWSWWLGVVGPAPNEGELRAPAALLGFACVPLCALAVRPYLGARGAALCALLLAASPWHLFWSQSARFYTLAAALALLGVACAAPAAARPARRALGFALAALAMLAHPSAGLVLPGLVLGPLLVRARPGHADRAQRRLAVGAVLVGLVGLASWAAPILSDWNAVKGGASPVELVLASGFFLTPAVVAAALLGLVDVAARRDHPAAPLVVLVVLGWAAALAVSLFMRVSAQYVYVLLPFTLALCLAPLAVGTATGTAAGMASAPARGSPARVSGFAALAFAAVLFAPLATGSFLYLTVRQGEREAWREAYAVVARERSDGDLVMGMSAPVGQYYLAPGSTDLREPTALEYLDQWRFDAAPFAAQTGRRTWFVVNQERFAEWPRERRDELRRMLREDCRLVADFPLQVESRDLSVQVFLRE